MRLDQKIKFLKDQLKNSIKENYEEITLIKEEKEKKIKTTANQRKRQKHEFKNHMLASAASNEIDAYEETILDTDLTDFSDDLKAKALTFGKRKKARLEEKAKHLAQKELNRLNKIKRKNDKIISEGARFIKDLMPLVNVYLDMDEIEKDFMEIYTNLREMEEATLLPAKQFETAFKEWLDMRERAEIITVDKKDFYDRKYAYVYDDSLTNENEDYDYEEEN